MRFSTVFFVLASGAMALAAAVAPAALVARGDDQALAIVEKLSASVDISIGELGQCYNDISCHGKVVDDIKSAYDTACDDFAKITVKIEEDISGNIADIYIKISEAVKTFTSSCDQSLVEEVIEVYAELDEHYCGFLNAVVVIVTDIFVSVGGFLRVQVDLFVFLKLNGLIGLLKI